MSEKETKKKTTKKTTTKRKAKTEKIMNEVEQEAKAYEEQVETEKNLEFPLIVLPCRGYFKKLDHGMYVENLQTAMNHIVMANIPVTGEYDDATMRAVEKFEEQYGGCINGKFGGTELKAYNKLRGVR